MGGRFVKDLGDTSFFDGSRRVWSTGAYPIAALPDDETLTISTTVTFPDFVKNNLSIVAGFTVTPPLPLSPYIGTNAITYATILPGEYGPDKAGAYYIAPQYLGALPEGVADFEVRAVMTRTAAPSSFQGYNYPPFVPQGKSLFLDGGSLAVSGTNAYRRTLQIVRVGDDLYLHRRQSVKYRALAHSPMKSDPQVWTGGPNGPWLDIATHGGSPAGWRAYELDRRVGGDVNKQRGGGNSPSLTDTSNYSETWSAVFTIRPVHIPS